MSAAPGQPPAGPEQDNRPPAGGPEDPLPMRRTPLHECHLEAGARMVPFAGWEMPVQYAGVIEEHRAVRTAAGLFDVSHMGEVRVRGAGAERLLQRLTPNDVSKLAPGRAHYSGLLTERGTYVDDLLIYRLARRRLPGRGQRLQRRARLRVDRLARRRSRTPRWSTRATATPCSPSRGRGRVEILEPLARPGASALRYYGFAPGRGRRACRR